MKTIERIKVNLNPELKIQGILLTMYDRRNKLSSQVEQEARDYFKEKVYQTVIPRNVRLSEAPSHGVPVLIYDKNCLEVNHITTSLMNLFFKKTKLGVQLNEFKD